MPRHGLLLSSRIMQTTRHLRNTRHQSILKDDVEGVNFSSDSSDFSHWDSPPPPLAVKVTTLILDRLRPPPPWVMAAAAADTAGDVLGSAEANLRTVDHSSAHSDSLKKIPHILL